VELIKLILFPGGKILLITPLSAMVDVGGVDSSEGDERRRGTWKEPEGVPLAARAWGEKKSARISG
jgi:hypothetical protein